MVRFFLEDAVNGHLAGTGANEYTIDLTVTDGGDFSAFVEVLAKEVRHADADEWGHGLLSLWSGSLRVKLVITNFSPIDSHGHYKSACRSGKLLFGRKKPTR